MIGRRATVGLALLCALLFSAIAVANASAAAATNTTLFTCVKTVKPETGTFNDEHCDSDNAGKKGNFEHEAFPIKPPETTEVEITNETTEGKRSLLTFKGQPFGVKIHIECEELNGTGSLGNTEEGKVHKISGKATLKYTKCKVTEPGETCKVVEPIEAKVETTEGVEGIEGPNKEANAMGIELKGKPFATLTLEGSCGGIKEFPVTGSVIGTSGPTLEAGKFEKQTNKWAGATSIFYMSSLEAGGKPAEYKGNSTIRMKSKGNPITATTVT